MLMPPRKHTFHRITINPRLKIKWNRQFTTFLLFIISTLFLFYFLLFRFFSGTFLRKHKSFTSDQACCSLVSSLSPNTKFHHVYYNAISADEHNTPQFNFSWLPFFTRSLQHVWIKNHIRFLFTFSRITFACINQQWPGWLNCLQLDSEKHFIRHRPLRPAGINAASFNNWRRWIFFHCENFFSPLAREIW